MRILSTTSGRLASLVLVTGLVLVQPAAEAEGGHSRAELAASAQASPTQPTVTESLTSWDKVGRDGKASTVATASATCDGCSADATAVHVVRSIGGGIASADNVATAWSASCTGCAATAVSVQVVLVAGSGPIVANNRSLALNATCVGCSSEATAVQFVLIGSKRSELSEAAEELLTQLAAQLANDQSAAAGPSPSTAGARKGKALVRTPSDLAAAEGRRLQLDVGASAVTVRVDRHTGG